MAGYQRMVALKDRIALHRSHIAQLNQGIKLLRLLATRREQLFAEKRNTAGFIDNELQSGLSNVQIIMEVPDLEIVAMLAAGHIIVISYVLTPNAAEGISHFEVTKDNGSSQGRIVAMDNSNTEVDLEWDDLIDDATAGQEDQLLISNAQDPLNNGIYTVLDSVGAPSSGGTVIFDAVLNGSTTAKDKNIKLTLFRRDNT